LSKICRPGELDEVNKYKAIRAHHALPLTMTKILPNPSDRDHLWHKCISLYLQYSICKNGRFLYVILRAICLVSHFNEKSYQLCSIFGTNFAYLKFLQPKNQKNVLTGCTIVELGRIKGYFWQRVTLSRRLSINW